jgi:hypothetical protein
LSQERSTHAPSRLIGFCRGDTLPTIEGKDRYMKMQELCERLYREQEEAKAKPTPKRRGRKPKAKPEEPVVAEEE